MLEITFKKENGEKFLTQVAHNCWPRHSESLKDVVQNQIRPIIQS